MRSLSSPALASSIAFISRAKGFTLRGTPAYRQWVKRIFRSYKAEFSEIQFVFLQDTDLHKVNVAYLAHDTYTDIITFDYSYTEGTNRMHSGEIFISIERVTDNARTYRCTFEQELLRVMAHGVLHLLGFTDKTPADKKKMRKAENTAIALFGSTA